MDLLRSAHRSARLAGLLAAAPLAAVGCGAGVDDGSPGWTVTSPDALRTARRAQLERGIAARDALSRGLFAELSEAMKSVGPAGAIDVCSEAAPRLADEIAEAHGLRIGRTAPRLRNPSNAPPAWARAVIDERGDPEEDVVVLHSDGRLGALLPIFVMEPCLRCHGAPGALADGVGEALARAYPDDRATGFADGDLRGWFWVEVPPAQ
ncbi:MAG: DUF3365 domain-containing protein [Planctomycetota bacterium]